MMSLRERHLFRSSGRTLVVAMDHSRSFDSVTGLKNPNAVIKAVIAGGADAVLTPYGTAKDAAEVLGSAGRAVPVSGRVLHVREALLTGRSPLA